LTCVPGILSALGDLDFDTEAQRTATATAFYNRPPVYVAH
jgi:hypothetical protein